MSDVWKVSGKKWSLPSLQTHQWKFSSRPGGWIIAEDKTGQRARCMINESKGRLSISMSGNLWQGECWTERRQLSNTKKDEDLVAQFPGKIRKLLVKIGDSLQEGDPMVSVEAMKMEFVVKAPFAAVVRAILVKEGQQIGPGDRFLELEESQSV